MACLDQTFSALSDATRRAIVARLAAGETSLSDIAAPFEMSQTAVSKHVRVLSDAGGRTRYCSLATTPMRAASNWLETYQRFWELRFGALAEHIESELS